MQDLPDFLHGDERFKSQHLSLKFRHETGHKSESPLSESSGSYVSASSDGQYLVPRLQFHNSLAKYGQSIV